MNVFLIIYGVVVRLVVEVAGELTAAERLAYFYRSVPKEPLITSMLSFSPHLLFLLIPPLQIIAFARMRLLPKARLTLRMYFQSLCSFSLPPSPPSLFPHSLPPHLLILLYQISVAYDVQGATVVSNFSLKIQPTEKIGIIGRTGAGKVPYFFLYHPSGGFFYMTCWL